MAVIDDETVLAYAAARALAALYDAYRASSRAHILVLNRVGVGLEDEEDDEEQLGTVLQLVRRASLARETDAAFAIRSEQLRGRLLELRGLPEPP